MTTEFRFPNSFGVNSEVLAHFKEYGYIVVRGLLTQQEVLKLKNALERDPSSTTYRYKRNDGEGRQSKTLLWNHPGDDITGMIGRSDKVVGTFEKLLGGEVYHYHAKMIMKEAHTGGAHLWHQDYGYWYENGNLFPDMGTVWIAVDRAEKSNGCLKIIPGSHKLGRIDHTRVGDQAQADLERVKWAEDHLGLLYAELDPGDALFFHSNLLHRSEPNNSPNRRWGYLCCYNRASNNPVYEHHHPQYTPLTKVPNSAIMKCGDELKDDGKDFFIGVKDDSSLKRIMSH